MSTSTQDIALSSERRQNSSGQSPCEFRCWDYLKNLHNLLLKYFILNSLEFRQEMLRAILYWTKFLFDIKNWFWQKCKSEVNFCCCKNYQYYWWLWANFSMTCQPDERGRAWSRCVILISGQADSVWSDCTEATADHWPLYKCHPAPLSPDNKN